MDDSVLKELKKQEESDHKTLCGMEGTEVTEEYDVRVECDVCRAEFRKKAIIVVITDDHEIYQTSDLICSDECKNIFYTTVQNSAKDCFRCHKKVNDKTLANWHTDYAARTNTPICVDCEKAYLDSLEADK